MTQHSTSGIQWGIRPAHIPSATDTLPDKAIEDKEHKKLLEESLEKHKEIWERMAGIEKELGLLKEELVELKRALPLAGERALSPARITTIFSKEGEY